MRAERLLAAPILLALAAVGSPAWGCSVVAGAAFPTNYEIVREAEAIVLARSVHWQPSVDPERAPWGSVRFEVEEVLKGDFRPSTVTLDGNLEFAGRGPENDFSRARPGTYAGSCQADDYRLDHHYLFFLRRDDLNERWSLGGPVMTRLNEEVDVADSPWLQAVRHYARVAALRDYEKEKAALQELRAKAAAGTAPKTFPKALVADLDRHFRTPSVAKSPADLIDLYRHAESDAAQQEALRGLAATAPPAARDLLRGLLLKETRERWLQPLAEYFSKVPDHEVFGPLSQTLAHLPPDSWTRRDVLRALSTAAGPQDAPRMTELLREVANGDQAAILALWFASPGRDPRAALAILHDRLRDSPGDFSRYQDALAILGDAPVIAWAEERIWRGSEVKDRWESARALAYSPLAAADAAARKIIDSGNVEKTEWLLLGYTDSFARVNPRRWDRLEDVLQAQSRNASFLAKLKTSFFYLRRDGDEEEKAMASRLFERTREAILALPTGSRSNGPIGPVAPNPPQARNPSP